MMSSSFPAATQELPHIHLDTDVLVIGAGPLGSTFARKLVDGGRKVLMIDAGDQLSKRPGQHLKNAWLYQRDVNQFTGVISGHLHTLSVPTDKSAVPTLDPGAFSIQSCDHSGFLSNNQNPVQNPCKNLKAAAASYCVGGMAVHWTCACPRQHPTIERSPLISMQEWEDLYKEGEELLHIHDNLFDDSVRNKIVRKVLKETYPDLPAEYKSQNLPLAAELNPDCKEFVNWTGTDVILGDALIKMLDDPVNDNFQLKPQWQCIKLVCTEEEDSIKYAKVLNVMKNEIVAIHANTFVLAAGAVLSPQILFNSDIRPKALGRYLCEQPMAFCQVVFLQSIIDEVQKDEDNSSDDPIPIPLHDPPPQCWIPVSEGREWHCQIHRDAFSYGGVAPNVDDRLIVDLRWFGRIEPNPENRVEFSEKIQDAFGMPQPTFHFELSKKDGERQHEMMKDMLKCAAALGGFLPGSEPQFMDPGLSLHITVGTLSYIKCKCLSIYY
jgi:pyranose oxidase